jgi:hypothetical protein
MTGYFIRPPASRVASQGWADDYMGEPLPVDWYRDQRWRLSEHGTYWSDVAGNYLLTVILLDDGYWQGRVLRKGPRGSPFAGEIRKTLFYVTCEEAQLATCDLLERMDWYREGQP